MLEPAMFKSFSFHIARIYSLYRNVNSKKANKQKSPNIVHLHRVNKTTMLKGLIIIFFEECYIKLVLFPT